MATRKWDILKSPDKFEMTPMIDVVFLLLIYFLWTTDLTQESDLGIQLPAKDAPEQPDEAVPNENVVEILPDGTVLLNRAPMDNINSRDMPQLTRTLTRLQQSSARIDQKMVLTIDPHDLSPHQRMIDVLNAASEAQVRLVSVATN